MSSYGGSVFHPINRLLRGQRLPKGRPAAEIRGYIAELDAVMSASQLDREVLTYRGVVDAAPMFGPRLNGDLTGMVWREDAYISTSVDKAATGLFHIGSRGAEKPMALRIVAPAGTPAVEVSNMRVEGEVLLGRGLRLRVVADRGVDPQGVRHIDVEVLGA